MRRKKNRSGSVSVVVVSKERGKFRELQTIGVSTNEDEIKPSVSGRSVMDS